MKIQRFGLRGAVAAAACCLSTLAIAGERVGPATDSTVESSMVGMDDALTTGASVSELQFTFFYSEAQRAFGGDGSTTDRADNNLMTGVVTFTHGLTHRVDLTLFAFGVAYSDDDEPDNRGGVLGDLFMNVKWRFHGNGLDGIQIAYRPGLSIPVGDEDEGGALAPGLGFWTASQTVIATLLERSWNLDLEIGFLLPIGDRDETRRLDFAGIGAGYQVARRVKPLVELHYLREVFDDGPNSELLAVTGGVVINPTDSMRLDLGLRQGVWGKNAEQRLTGSINLSFTFGSG